MEKSGKTKLSLSSESGMTLMEVMVSMVMLGVVLVALGQGIALGIRMNTEAKTKVSNLSIAKRVMERVKSQIQRDTATFDGANNNFRLTLYVDANGNDLNSNQPGPTTYYIVNTNVSNWTDSGGNTLSATDAVGTSRVLVKVLTVTVAARQSAVSRAVPTTTLACEMVRPSE